MQLKQHGTAHPLTDGSEDLWKYTPGMAAEHRLALRGWLRDSTYYTTGAIPDEGAASHLRERDRAPEKAMLADLDKAAKDLVGSSTSKARAAWHAGHSRKVSLLERVHAGSRTRRASSKSMS